MAKRGDRRAYNEHVVRPGWSIRRRRISVGDSNFIDGWQQHSHDCFPAASENHRKLPWPKQSQTYAAAASWANRVRVGGHVANVVSGNPALSAIPDIVRDDFNGGSLNSSIWNIGTWSLGRTQLGFTPQITGGIAHLRLDTYNPTNTGGSFKGTDLDRTDAHSRRRRA